MSATSSMPCDGAVARPGPRRSIANDLLAGVPALWLGLFFLAPLGFTAVYSFAHSTFGGAELGFTLENYSVATSGFYGATFFRTLVFAFLASALCLAVAFPLAYFIARRTDRHRLFTLALILIPYFSSFLIRVMSLQLLMSPQGFAEVSLNLLLLHRGPLDLLDSQAAVFIGMVYAYLPIAVVPIFVVLDRIPKALIEASRDLGASRWQTFVTITFPLSRPGIATALLLTAAPMIGEMVIPNLLGGGRGVLVGQAMSAQFLQSQNYPLGSAMAVLILTAVAIIVGLLARMTKGFAETGR
jgi:ABC-type spermidine/putrescine transport system permease subunit I